MNKKILVLYSLFFFLFACNLANINQKAPVTSTATFMPVVGNTQTKAPVLPSATVEDAGNSYQIQSGDTLPALSMRFKVSQEEIMEKNPDLFSNEPNRTLPPGQKLRIEILPELTGLPEIAILPDGDFVYGPELLEFDARAFANEAPGWLMEYVDNSSGNAVSGIKILQQTADNYSISPKILLALVEYHLHGLSDPHIPSTFSLGNSEPNRKSFGKQLSWAANALNNGYYGWREGVQTEFFDIAGAFIRPHPTSNAGSVAFQYYFSRFLSGKELDQALSPDGFQATYQNLFGPIVVSQDQNNILIPENLQQPNLLLPLQHNVKWSFSGGPHSGWGVGYPYAAIDFAPPAEKAGCDPSPYFVTAAADGVVSWVVDGILSLDIDGDGSVRTGWNILYIHLSLDKQFHIGDSVQKGQALGHPSCLAGSSSGRNIHIARLYNGEWIPAGGSIPLNLGGWTAAYGEKEYKGYLTGSEKELRSSNIGEWFSQLTVAGQ